MLSHQPDVSPKSLCIVIVGAGISGLSAAIGLCRAGHVVTVLEQSSELREVGAGIQLPANSSRILEELGLLQTVKRASIQPSKLLIRSYRQNKLYEQDLNPAIEQKFQYPHLLIHRATLIQILYAEAQNLGATVYFGACVERVSLSEVPKVELVTGRPYEADLILGADGEHSVCRALLLGRRDPPHSSGDMVFRLLIPIPRIALQPSLCSFIDPLSVHAWYGPKSHSVCYPLPKEGIFNVVLTFSEEQDALTIGPQPADLGDIRNRCREWDPDFQLLLRLADKAMKWTLLQTDELETWVHPSGRLALLGDSAHATLPYLAQGAAMALESAYTLSSLLRHASNATELPEILALYQNLRLPRARRTRERSGQMRDMSQLVDGPAQEERDRTLKEDKPGDGFPNPWADPGFQEWMWAFDARATADSAWEDFSGKRNEIARAEGERDEGVICDG